MLRKTEGLMVMFFGAAMAFFTSESVARIFPTSVIEICRFGSLVSIALTIILGFRLLWLHNQRVKQIVAAYGAPSQPKADAVVQHITDPDAGWVPVKPEPPKEYLS